MRQLTDPGRIRPISHRYSDSQPVHIDQEILQRVTGLITLGVNLINILIIMRFLLDLLDASLLNPFAQLIYSTSRPFLSMFQGLTHSSALRDVTLELTILIAITVYSLLGWSVNKLLRILFAR